MVLVVYFFNTNTHYSVSMIRIVPALQMSGQYKQDTGALRLCSHLHVPLPQYPKDSARGKTHNAVQSCAGRGINLRY